MKTSFEVLTIKGNYRSNNQDNFYLNGISKHVDKDNEFLAGTSDSRYQLFAVCDGMGGEDAGEVAAALAVEVLAEFEAKAFKKNWKKYIRESNRIICKYQDDNNLNMGTTFAGLCFSPYHVCAVNVGDSRIYRIRDDKIKQLSKDHNEYQSMIDAGICVDEKTARRSKSRLTQCLGMSEEKMVIEPHAIITRNAKKGDVYLLCSDGLYGRLTDEEILQSVEQNLDNKDNICEILVSNAKQAGSRDNITALIIFIEGNSLFENLI